MSHQPKAASATGAPPQRVTTRAAALALACLFTSLNCASPASGGDQIILKGLSPKMDKLPSRRAGAPLMLHGSVGQTVSATEPTNIFGYAQRGNRFPTTVTSVEPQTPAWLAGLHPGDLIFGGHAFTHALALTVVRGHKRYLCVLDLSAITAKKDATATGTTRLKGNAEQTAAQTLADHAIVLAIDSSASMGTKDCPGGISRWEWCRQHTRDLYSEVSAGVRHNVSILIFDSSFRSFQHCNMTDFSRIFQNNEPAGESNMAPPLQDAFATVQDQLHNGKPAVIAVISDGRPSDVDNLKHCIINEANSLRDPSLLTLAFVEIGTPEHYLRELDNDLVKQGAQADIVTVIPFSSVNSQGLAKTLATAILQARTPTAEKVNPVKLSATQNSAEDKARRAAANQKPAYQGQASSAASPPAAADHPKPPPRPVVVQPAPPVVAHPSGTAAPGTEVTAKPQEVDEKESVRRSGANRTYRFDR